MMFSKLHDRLGTAGLVVAIVALVAALAGTAFAATKLNSTQKKEVKAIAKQFAGKPGKNGANGKDGAPGSPGPQGPAGPAGAAGAAGKDGSTGATGAAGATGKEGPTGKGTTGVTGTTGTTGTTGAPWPAGGTLPPGATETGSWFATVAKRKAPAAPEEAAIAPISFPIKLSAGLAQANVRSVNSAGVEFNSATFEFNDPPTTCTGSPEVPTAPSGFLCVYASVGTGLLFITKPGDPGGATNGTSASGAKLIMTGELEEEVYGTFAVTG